MTTAEGWLHIHMVHTCAQQQGTLHALYIIPTLEQNHQM